MVGRTILYISLLVSLFIFVKLGDMEIFNLKNRILISLIFPFLIGLVLLLGAVGFMFVGILLILGTIFFALNKDKIKIIRI
ncbi:hypothetical protein HOA59_00130 [archaeon]|jgi:hypothetical protein|nr:hypothetical protein [archaeon]MBT6823830.1 hypothetical protein [archaeon]MBT7107135.1 hypothetical protein [archaeon]MBT7297245.1 hypothetical protein [archaeon]